MQLAESKMYFNKIVDNSVFNIFNKFYGYTEVLTDLTFCAEKKATVSNSFHNIEPHFKKHTALLPDYRAKQQVWEKKIIETCYMQVTPHPVSTECKQECCCS